MREYSGPDLVKGQAYYYTGPISLYADKNHAVPMVFIEIAQEEMAERMMEFAFFDIYYPDYIQKRGRFSPESTWISVDEYLDETVNGAVSRGW